LASVGEISAKEAVKLKRHLDACAQCRTLVAEFRRIGLEDFSLAAAMRVDSTQPPASLPLSDSEIQSALDRVWQSSENDAMIQNRAALRPIAGSTAARKLVFYWSRRLTYAAAVALVCWGGIEFYRIHLHQVELQYSNTAMSSEVEYWKAQAKYHTTHQSATEAALRSSTERADAAVAALQAQRALDSAAKQEQQDLESRIAANASAYAQLNQELQAERAGRVHDHEQQRTMALEIQDLKNRAKQQPRDVTPSPSSVLRVASESPAVASAPRVTIAEATDLFGARDLHIVDVYSVNSSGGTGKIYGRVYYVNRRLLLFYAFDLPDLPGKHAVFQAWGYLDPNSSKLDNLGTFSKDDSSLNRWSLKVTDPMILSRIDTLFVTAEPPGGSPAPKGKKLLLASLAGPPNHP
jgi:hypothetical protein